AGSAVDRNCRIGTLETVFLAGVAAGRVAHDFNRELDLLRRAVGVLGRPRKWNSEQAAIEQQGMRASQVLREPGTIRTVEGGEYGIFPIGQAPALIEAHGRYAHPISRLMTIDTGSPVCSQGSKEGM